MTSSKKSSVSFRIAERGIDGPAIGFECGALFGSGTVDLGLDTPEVEERALPPAAPGRDPRQSGGTGATGQAHQHGLRLVIEAVAEEPDFAGSQRRIECGVAGIPCPGLEIRTVDDRNIQDRQLDVEVVAESCGGLGEKI